MTNKILHGIQLPVLLGGILLLVFGGGEVFAQSKNVSSDVAYEKCSAYSKVSLGVCTTCLQMADVMMSNSACKDYLPLMGSQASADTAPVPEVITLAEIEQEIPMIRQRCDRFEQLNCQCWENEYRENRLNGLEQEAAATEISSSCVSIEKIKAFQYPRCVIREKQWTKIVEFESYCGCVADYIGTNIKRDWSDFGGADNLSKNLRLDATKACGYAQQEKLSAEVANERIKKYGRRGPPLDLLAWKNMP